MTGEDGEVGPEGPPGLPGASGAAGIPGPPGMDGDDLFDGFNGVCLDQYLYLPGRGGGQLGYGGVVTADNLTFRANTAAYAVGNTGRIQLDDRIALWPSIPTNPGVTIVMVFGPTFAVSSGATSLTVFNNAATVNSTTSSILSLNTFSDTSIININASPGVADFAMALAQQTINIAAATTTTIGSVAYGDTRTYQANNVVVSNGANNISHRYVPIFKALGASGSLTMTGDVSLATFNPTLTVDTVGGVLAMTNLRGLNFFDVVKSGAGAAGITLTNLIGVDVAAIAGGLNNLALRAGAAIIASFLLASFTIQTGYYGQFTKRGQITGATRVKIQGTGRGYVHG